MLTVHTRDFIRTVSSKIRSLKIWDRIYNLDIDLSNVTQIQWCFPQGNLKIFNNLSALKWCSLCTMNESIWNLLTVYCPTLESLITACQYSNSACFWWEYTHFDTLPLNVMNNLMILVISKSISIKLVPTLIKACPSLLHLMVDGRVTMETDIYMSSQQKMLRKLKLPSSLVSFGISAKCAVEVDVNFDKCRYLQLLNIPIITAFGNTMSISRIFQDFIECHNNNEVLISINQYELESALDVKNVDTCISKFKKSVLTPIIFQAPFNVIISTIDASQIDDYLISKLLQHLFIKSKIRFIKSNDILTSFIDHLGTSRYTQKYVKLIKRASQTGFLSTNFQPLFSPESTIS